MSNPWQSELDVIPRVWPADGFSTAGPGDGRDVVEPIWYEGPPFAGKPTRIFAWLGRPMRPKGPAMVLVHGGLGTAFEDWVRLWTSRGFAAIAMDTCGCTPTPEGMPRGWNYPWPRHQHAGPAGWGGFDRVEEPVADQWMYHAVAAAIRANSLLRSLGDVDTRHIALTGISWGGIIACCAAGVDSRLAMVAPVYGCGFLRFARMQDKVPPPMRHRWLDLWDPSNFLAGAAMPMLWVNGTNDVAFPLDAQQRSYRLAPGPRSVCVRVRMVHAHGGPGERPEEIHAVARERFGLAAPYEGLARVTAQGRDGAKAWATYQAPSRVPQADFNYTRDRGEWTQRRWITVQADIDEKANRVSADVPDDASAYFFNLHNQWDQLTSTEHVECPG